MFDPFPFQSPVPAAPTVPERFIDTTPVRQPGLQPDYQVGVFTYRCNDCHAIIPPPASDRTRTVIQHREIQLEHGINTRCFNCHHPTNRDAFVDSTAARFPGTSRNACVQVPRAGVSRLAARFARAHQRLLGRELRDADAAQVHRMPRSASAAFPRAATGPRAAHAAHGQARSRQITLERTIRCRLSGPSGYSETPNVSNEGTLSDDRSARSVRPTAAKPGRQNRRR